MRPPVIKEQMHTENCSPVLGANSNFLKMAVDNNMQEASFAIFPVFLREFLDSDNEMIPLQKNMDDDVAESGKLLGHLDRNKIPKIEQFVELTVPRYIDANFHHHFRMSRETIEILIPMIGNCPEVLTEFDGNIGRPLIAIEKQILCYLWCMESYDSVAGRSGMAKSAAFNVVKRVGSARIHQMAYWSRCSRIYGKL